MKYIFCFLLVAGIATASLGSSVRPCGVPSCTKCAAPTPKPSCDVSYVKEEPCPDSYHKPTEPHKCVPPTTEPPCVKPYVEEKPKCECTKVPTYQECEQTIKEPSCEDVEVEDCPEGYAWNGYFCARSCEQKPHEPEYC